MYLKPKKFLGGKVVVNFAMSLKALGRLGKSVISDRIAMKNPIL
jgi:hypothetical protein